MDKEKRNETIAGFDPDNSVATNAGIFGLPFALEESEIVLYPVPWEVTVSYREGTANGPYQIFTASPQLDLYDHHFGEIWKKGIHFFTAHVGDMAKLNNNLRPIAKKYIESLEQGGGAQKEVLSHINEACFQLKETVKSVCTSLLNEGHKIGLVGGDHSTPLGYIEALAERHEHFGILQIDAHADLRDAYEGFVYSHASIMHNALAISENISLTQVGIRDYSKGERERMENDTRITTFFDADIKEAAFAGKTWSSQVEEIIHTLPDKVYVSFDADGLCPDLCSATGTPVPGGFSFEQAVFLLVKLKESGKEIIGFDLNETGNAEWDGTVSARLLYKMCGMF
ncbi:agmatinase [bacterium]|nr:agmatinase [bacterium]